MCYTYTYDNVGNITSKSDGTSTITYTYGTDSDAGWSKLLTSYNGESIDYDAIGNPTTYRGATLSWTGRQLDSYSKDGTTITYTYDADGLRGSKTVDGAKSIYQYVDGTLLYEDRYGTDIYYYYDSYGTISAISVHLPNGVHNYVLVGTNSLGDVNALYNANGDMLVKYEYDAWGKVLAETDASGNALTGVAATWSQLNPFRYRGYYYDSETQLYYLQSRYYDAEVGRFLNSDSIIDNRSTTSINTYVYCGNNPVNFSDPSGYFLKEAWNWTKNKAKAAVKWVADELVKPVVKGIKNAITSSGDKTKTVGINGSAAFGGVTSGSVGITTDNKGNIGIIFTGNVGGGTPSASMSLYKSVTNAPDIYKQRGISTQMGGSVDVYGVSVGAEFSFFSDYSTNKTYYGGTALVGIGVPSILAEIHAEIGYSYVYGFNVFDFLESTYIKIMEW